MRPIRFLFLTLFAAAVAVGGETSSPASPEDAILAPVKALRQNDVLALFKAMPADDQAEAEAEWLAGRDKPPGEQDAQFDQMMQVASQPGAVDMLMAQAEPALAQFDPQQLGFQLQMGAGMLGMALASSPEGVPFAEAIQGIATDLMAWLPAAGINDPAKLRQALTHLIAASQAFGVTDSAGLKALALDEVLHRSGDALNQIKSALVVYGCDLDAFLDSLAVTDVAGTGDQRTAKLQFIVLGKPRTLPLKLKLENGTWVSDPSTFAPLQNLANQGGGPGPGPGMDGPMVDEGEMEMDIEPIPAVPATEPAPTESVPAPSTP